MKVAPLSPTFYELPDHTVFNINNDDVILISHQDLEDELDDIKRKSRKPKMDEDEAAAMVRKCPNFPFLQSLPRDN